LTPLPLLTKLPKCILQLMLLCHQNHPILWGILSLFSLA
jgi:hypothetical protein